MAPAGQDWLWLATLALLALVPIPFGSNRPWAWSALALSSSLLLGIWGVLILLGRRRLVWRPALIFPAVAAGLLLVWILVSIVPGVGDPNPIWAMASEQLKVPLPGTLAISRSAVLTGLMKLLSYAIIFWLSLQYCRDARRAEQLLVWTSWTGLALALYGLINYLAGNPYLLWYDRFFGEADVTATFVNRNHYATYAGLGLLCSAAVGVTAFRAAWQLSDRSQKPLARTIECLMGRPLVYVVIMLVIGMAWLQTHSRMGAAAVLLGGFAMLLMMMAVRLIRRRLSFLLIPAALIIFLFMASGSMTLDRWSQTNELDRGELFSIVGDQIETAPYAGSGYGTFAQAFQIYRDQRLSTPVIFTEAHNSYLELAAELGIPAAALLVLTVGWLAVLCMIGVFRRQRGQIFPIVAVAATVAVGAHALVDFSVQIPAVAALYAALLGMGVAQSVSSEKRP